MPPHRSPELRVVAREPFNAETPLEAQVGVITPVARHYIRSHFALPAPPERLEVDGLVRTPLTLALDDLRAMPSRSAVVTLECAGNGRAFVEPAVPGEPWALGAVSTAEWTGVPLRELLRRADVLPAAREVVFRGADAGVPKDLGREIAYERSLTVEEAHREDVLVAYAMNGEPLTPDHGAPLRLVVPGAYGMAAVKWLARVTAVADAFGGFYQRDRYVIDGEPLGPIAPRAVIVAPRDGGRIAAGRAVARGYAWSGGPPLAGVEVSTDGGSSWRDAALGDALAPHAWRQWEHVFEAVRGEMTIVARAVTSTGERQPASPVRNALGYANNASRPVRFSVVR